MDVLKLFPKVSCVVRLVLQKHARCPIPGIVLWVMRISFSHQKELLHGGRGHGQQCCTQLLQRLPSGLFAPEVDAKMKIQLFRGRLFIFYLWVRCQATAPRVQVKPVEASKTREVWIMAAGIRSVSNQAIDKVHKIGIVLPFGLQFCQDGSSDYEIPKVVVVVVAGVSEICQHAVQNWLRVPCGVVPNSAGQTTPVRVVEQASWRSSTLGGYLVGLGPAENALEASREPAGAKATLRGSEELLCQEADHGHLLEAFATKVEVRLKH